MSVPANRWPLIPCAPCGKPTQHTFKRGARPLGDSNYMHLWFTCDACGAERVYGNSLIDRDTRSALVEAS